MVLAQRAEHLRLTRGILIGVGQDRREAEVIESVLDAGRELSKKGLLRSLITMPTKSDEAARKLAAPR